MIGVAMQKEIKLISVLGTALKTGLLGAIINSIWLQVFLRIFEITGLPKGFEVAVVLSSLFPVLLAGFVYYFLVSSLSRGYALFLVLGIAFLAFSNFPAFDTNLPDGSPMPSNFKWLVIPMHFISGFLALYQLPNKHPYQKK